VVDRAGAVIRAAVAYVVMLGGTVALFLLIRARGQSLGTPAATGTPGQLLPPASSPETLFHVLLAITAVIVVGQLLSRMLGWIGQPPVIGEVAAGILLGPSLIGPYASSFVLPPDVAPFLGVIAQLGVILYMFLVGLDVSLPLLNRRARLTILTSHASIVVPFVLGAGLALAIYPRVSSSDVSFTSFALFMGVALSITAFPVLARILTDRGLAQTELGTIALSCAAIDDVTAWCLLAFVVGVARAEPGTGVQVAALAVAYIAFMLVAARPLLERVTRRWSAAGTSSGQAAAMFVALLLSALITERIGIHAIFGAFLLGAIVPHDSSAARTLNMQMRDLVTVLLLPAFFAFTGMRTRIDLLSTGSDWLLAGLITLVATVGKFGGAFVAARLGGMRARDAAVLGALMNTRGLMELIVLNIGLEMHVISPRLFAMMVIMALVTTMSAAPALKWFKIDPTANEPVTRAS
jgi:K+:H+ antiporter